jgi:hypothetical protein
MDANDFQAKPGRGTVALSVMQMAYAQAFENYRNQENKAASIASWTAAVMAVSMFQTFSAGSHHIAWLKLIAFFFLTLAAIIAIFALPARINNKLGINDPLDVLKQQHLDYWEKQCPVGQDVNAFAEAGTQKQLIEKVNDAIIELRKEYLRKAGIVYASLVSFVIGIAFLGVYALSPLFSKL